MVAKQKHFLDSIRQIVSRAPDEPCPTCNLIHKGECAQDEPGNDVSGQPDTADSISGESATLGLETAFLVDLVSNHKIKIQTPSCEIGRDETNDIVVSGDQSISRHHLRIFYEDGRYYLEDNNSRHGTFLNGSQVKTRLPINDGDVLKMGVSLFWFVIEAQDDLEDNSLDQHGLSSSIKPAEEHRLAVAPEGQPDSSDGASSTMNEIPIIAADKSLLDSTRLKACSFDQAGLFVNSQTPGLRMPELQSQPLGNTAPVKQPVDLAVVTPAPEQISDINSIEQVESEGISTVSDETPTNIENKEEEPTAWNLPKDPQELIEASPVYDQFMGIELGQLTDKYNDLKEKIEESQKEIKQLAEQLNTIRLLSASLIGGVGQRLIEACNKVLTSLGWEITFNPNDNNELILKYSDQIAIVRIIWTKEEPERSQLGQLAISQTRLWCDQGEEPKGILIVARLADNVEDIPTLTEADYESDLAKFAVKKNVCMMTSTQVLALYRSLFLKESEAENLREKIMSGAGWLKGFSLETHSPEENNSDSEAVSEE